MSKTVDKALEIIDLVAQSPKTLAEISANEDLPKSTAHRLVKHLLSRGYLELEDGRYKAGMRILELAELVRNQMNLPSMALSPMRALADRTGETVHLGQLVESEVVYLQKVTGTRSLQMASHIGLRIPFQYTAMGKAIVAAQPRSTWDTVAVKPTARTANSITSKSALERELNAIRETGFALDREENEMGIRCVAVPVFDSSGVIGALSISGAAIHINDQRQEEISPELLKAAAEISLLCGGKAWQARWPNLEQ